MIVNDRSAPQCIVQRKFNLFHSETVTWLYIFMMKRDPFVEPIKIKLL